MWSAYRHGLNVTKLHCYIVTWHIVTPSPKAAKSNHRGPIFTDSRPRNSCVPSVASETSSSDGSF